jgi:hypothetical protein
MGHMTQRLRLCGSSRSVPIELCEAAKSMNNNGHGTVNPVAYVEQGRRSTHGSHKGALSGRHGTRIPVDLTNRRI